MYRKNRRGPNQPPRSAAPPMQAPNVPNVPNMASVPDTRSATDQISGTLASMNPQQLYTLMTQMKVSITMSGIFTKWQRVNQSSSYYIATRN